MRNERRECEKNESESENERIIHRQEGLNGFG